MCKDNHFYGYQKKRDANPSVILFLEPIILFMFMIETISMLNAKVNWQLFGQATLTKQMFNENSSENSLETATSRSVRLDYLQVNLGF